MSALGTMRRSMFGIPSARSVFRRPGFAWGAWDTFEPVARSLMEGYHATLECSDLSELADRLAAVDGPFQGFAYEGAGMGLAALDAIGPWRDRVGEFAQGPAASHVFPFYVGVGLAYARLHAQPEAHLAHLDPVLGWVTADGYGFHEAFFHRARTVDQHVVPRRLSAYARRMFDQGVGRAIWFSGGADAERTGREIEAYPESRRADLWGGVGLATSYGGGTDKDGLERVASLAGRHTAQLAVGAAIAAWGRVQADNLVEHTDLACRVYCGRTSRQAGALVEAARQHLPSTAAEPVHETWRRRVAASLATTPARGTDPDEPGRASFPDLTSTPPVAPTNQGERDV